MLTQSPVGVPSNQVRMWSSAAEAAEAAEEEPRALMTAAPRCCTVGMNVSSNHFWSTRLRAALAADRRVADVGVLRGRVIAPDGHACVTSATCVPVFVASCAARGCGRAASSR